MIRSIHDVKATDLGGQTVMFKAEADIDGREITRSYLEKIDIDKLLEVFRLIILRNLRIFLIYF
jgi:zinc transporter 9